MFTWIGKVTERCVFFLSRWPSRPWSEFSSNILPRCWLYLLQQCHLSEFGQTPHLCLQLPAAVITHQSFTPHLTANYHMNSETLYMLHFRAMISSNSLMWLVWQWVQVLRSAFEPHLLALCIVSSIYYHQFHIGSSLQISLKISLENRAISLTILVLDLSESHISQWQMSFDFEVVPAQ